jgi:hypothetical protein
MTKKAVQKHYTRKEIDEASRDGDKSIIIALATRLMSGEKLTLSEAEAASGFISHARPEGSIEKVNLAAIPQAQNYIFISLFLSYRGDLEGQYGILKFSGELSFKTRVVPIEEKKGDVIRLNEYYNEWNKKFAINNHKDQILNLVINEVNLDLKEIDSLLANGKLDKLDYDYRRKATILRSKYLYLRVTGVFEDLKRNEVIINFHDKIIEINPWSMVHVLNRHYAESVKQYDSGKSFHSDQNLKFFEDPEQLKVIIEKLATNSQTESCGIEYLPFKLNGIFYLVHAGQHEKHIKGSKIMYNRLETFYPVEDPIELKKIQTDYDEVIIDANLVGYSKK